MHKPSKGHNYLTISAIQNMQGICIDTLGTKSFREVLLKSSTKLPRMRVDKNGTDGQTKQQLYANPNFLGEHKEYICCVE